MSAKLKIGSGVPPLNQESNQSGDGLATLVAPTERKNVAQGKERSDATLSPESQNTSSPVGAKENRLLPNGWRWAQMSEVCTRVQDGTHFSPKEQARTGDFKYITAKNIKHWGLDLSDVTYVPERVHREIYKRCNVEKGDVLYIKDGVTTGIATVNTLDEEFSLLSSVALLKPWRDILDSLFLKYYLNSPEGFRNMTGQMTGTAIKRLILQKIKAAVVPVAPLDEQRKIVAEIEKQLTRLEAGVAALRRVQAKLKRYRAAVLKAACEGRLVPTEAALHQKQETKSAKFETGEELLARIRKFKAERIRSGEIRKPRVIDSSFLTESNETVPEGWALGRVEDFGAPEDNAIVDGPFGSNLKLSDYTLDGKYPVITITNIDEGFDLTSLRKVTEEKFEELKRSAVRTGDILVAKIGSSFGKTGIYPSHMPVGIIPANLLKLTPGAEMNWKYIFYHLHSLSFKKHLDTIVQYTAQPAFNVSKFKLLPVPIPPLVEQTRIVAEVERRLSVVEELEAVVSANLQRATRLRQSILQKAFSGRLATAEAFG